MGRYTTAIPVEGDRDYAAGLREFARRKGTTIAKVVRDALDEQYGSELGEVVALFAVNGNKNGQSATIPSQDQVAS